MLEPGDAQVARKKASALAAFVRERPGVARAEAVLAGFSNAVIARAIRSGRRRERSVRAGAERSRGRRAGSSVAYADRTSSADALERIEAALDARRNVRRCCSTA